MLLSEESCKKIDREIAKYPQAQKQSAVMAALRIAQTEHRWLSKDLISEVANYLEMPAMAVYEVASFYTMYDLQPVGRHKITVCTNLPCALRGAVNAAEYIQSKLNIGFNETTPDGLYTLKEGECMGACGDAPVMLHNNHRLCSHMTPEKIDQFLSELDK